MAKKSARKSPTPADTTAFRKKHGDTGVSLARDADGVFVHTHRARSKSYPAADKIPKKVVDFIDSTG